MTRPLSRLRAAFLAFLLLLGLSAPAAAAPEGTLTYGVHVTLAARWLDPAEAEGLITPFMVYYAVHDALVIRTMERASFLTAWREKKLKGVIVGITGASGNAATRLEAYVSKGGIYSSGTLPEIEDLFQRQARETDRARREALLHQIQQALHDRVMQVPIYELAFLWGVGPRVEEAGVDLIKGFAYSGPYEDLRLKRP